MNNKIIWTLIVIACTAVWGSIHPISKYLMETTSLSPVMMSMLRYGIAAIATASFFLAEKEQIPHVPFRDILLLASFGLIGVTGAALFIFYGIYLSNATSSAALINSQPVFAALLSALFLKEKLSLKQVIGILIGLAGLSLVVTRGDFTTFTVGTSYIAGNLLCIAAALSFSLYYILLKPYVITYGSTLPTFISTLFGSMILVLIALLQGDDFKALTTLSGEVWLWILYIGIFTTGIANVFFHKSITILGVAKATGYKFLVPVFGVFLSFFFLGERMNFLVYAGIIIVLIAIMFIQIPALKRKS